MLVLPWAITPAPAKGLSIRATVTQSIAYAANLLGLSTDVAQVLFYGTSANGFASSNTVLSEIAEPRGIRVTYEDALYQEVWVFHDDGRVVIVPDVSFTDEVKDLSYQFFDSTVYASVDLIPVRQFFQELVLLG